MPLLPSVRRRNMPTYDYECLSCDHTFEAFQSIKARRLRKCPRCGKRVRRLIGAGAGLLFRGSGFYETDYRSDDYKEKAKAEKGASSGKDAPEGKGKKDTGSAKESTGSKPKPKKAAGSKSGES